MGQRVFKGEPVASQTLPDETELGTSFIDWLKKNFRWLFANAQANTSIGTAYIYGDGQIPNWALLGEYDNGSAKGAGRTEYIWLPTQDGGAIPIGMFRNGKFFAIHPDHLGTPRLMTNEQNQPVWQWPYSAFGNNKPTGVLKVAPNPRAALTNIPVLLKATAATEMGLRMPGQLDDPETGTFQNFMRSYWPAQGRYTQVDPIGLRGGPNGYIYANQNPLTFIDPTGEIGIGGALFGAGLELALQAYKNYSDGCDLLDIDNYDWWDVGVSATVGAVAPGALNVGKTAWTSGSAARTISEQLGRARTANRAAKLQGRLNAHTGAIAEAVATQASWQGYKAVGTQFNGSKPRDCSCRR